MVNTHAIQQLEYYFQNMEVADNRFHDKFQYNVDKYLELKGLLHQVNVSENVYFQKEFANFYLVKRLPRPAKAAYFARFEELKDSDAPIEIREFTDEMTAVLGKNHFSFCSKMANMINDDAYPIYDSNVAAVFHRRGLGYGVDYRYHIFVDLRDTYNSLRGHHLVDDFRNRFHAEGVGHMKLLDTMYWFVGDCIKNDIHI